MKSIIDGLKKAIEYEKNKPTRTEVYNLVKLVEGERLFSTYVVRYVASKETIVSYSSSDCTEANITVEGARKLYKGYLEAGYEPYVKSYDDSPRCPENRDRADGGWSTK